MLFSFVHSKQKKIDEVVCHQKEVMVAGEDCRPECAPWPARCRLPGQRRRRYFVEEERKGCLTSTGLCHQCCDCGALATTEGVSTPPIGPPHSCLSYLYHKFWQLCSFIFSNLSITYLSFGDIPSIWGSYTVWISICFILGRFPSHMLGETVLAPRVVVKLSGIC